MAHFPEILDRIQEGGGWIPCDFESRKENCAVGAEHSPQARTMDEYDVIWRHSIRALLDSANSTIELMNEGLQYAGLQLGITPRPREKNFFSSILGVAGIKTTDLEADVRTIKSDQSQFSKLLEEKLAEFTKRRIEALMSWANSEGLSSAQLEKLNALGESDENDQPAGAHVHRDRQQLYLILYTQHMVSKKRMIEPAFQISPGRRT